MAHGLSVVLSSIQWLCLLNYVISCCMWDAPDPYYVQTNIETSYSDRNRMDEVVDTNGSNEVYSQEAYTEVTYVPIRVLGKGAFGEAVLYRKIEDSTLVVWKEVNLNRLGDKECRDAEKEVDILSLLDHANIITYYNHYVDSGMLLIEMEYANGGNLYQKIMQQEELMSEETVIWYFYQLVSAVEFIHSIGILHRDIKSLNIFLTKGGLCKLGDFGISRLMDSQTQMAETCVGTPYYMSPEIVKGEPYNSKSDIWSCGCVLYELCTLKRVFEATNALRLAAAIVQADLDLAVLSQYSDNMQKLIKDVLNKDATQRPSAKDILQYPCIASHSKDIEAKVWRLNTSARLARLSSAMVESQPIVVSQNTELYVWGGGKTSPRKLEIFTGSRAAAQISCSRNHYAVVTVEKELYSWTSSHGQSAMVGQLGHSDTASYKNPRRVVFFDGIPVKQVACGDEFTAVLADDGTLYTCGGDYYGCLAQDIDQVLTPTPVQGKLSSLSITHVSAGESHVVILTSCGKVFTWGCGEFGRLGHGDENDLSEPTEVTIPAGHEIVSVSAGHDCTFLITKTGRVLACGSNEHNKLGLNSEVRGLGKRKAKVSYDTPCVYIMKLVKPLRNNKIVEISSGHSHTAAITNYGQLLTFGCNKYGQLGLGDFRSHPHINTVAGILAGRKVSHVSCGENFTVISTTDNEVFACGNYQDGRLGIGTCTQNIALPRPLFGTLHAVANICCSHWETLLVADKVLSQKTISTSGVSRSVSASIAERQSSLLEEINEDSTDSNFTKSTAFLMSSTPAWVKQEFFEAADAKNPPNQPPPLLDLKLDLQTGCHSTASWCAASQLDDNMNEVNNNVVSSEDSNKKSSPLVNGDMDKSYQSQHDKITQLEAENTQLQLECDVKMGYINKMLEHLKKVDDEYEAWLMRNPPPV